MNKNQKLILPVLLLFLIIGMAFVGIFHSDVKINAVIDDDVLSQYNNNSVLQVDTIEDWRRFTKLPSGYTFVGKTVVLNCDIDLKMYPYIFNNFFGTLEGNNHSVYNAERPLFTFIASDGLVKDLHFYNINIQQRTAAVVITNDGELQNITTNGYIENSNASGLVYTNNGVISNCISYMTIKDSSNLSIMSTGNIGGIVYLNTNTGTIENSHYFGKQILTNNVTAGGIVGLNVGTIKKCSARIDYDIEVVYQKEIVENEQGEDEEVYLFTDKMEVGGLVGKNGLDSREMPEQPFQIFYGYVYNSFSIVNVNYISELALDFGARKLAVSGLIGLSEYTEMSYCYSDLSGEGTLYGIIHSAYATPITETVVPEEPDEPYDIVVDYDFHGTDDIVYCYSTVNMQPVIMWHTEDGTLYEILHLTNEQITSAQLLNNASPENDNLIDLLDNIDASWQGDSGQLPICSLFFEGQGTQLNPFEVKTKEDIFRLQAYMFYQPLSYYFEQKAEIDFYYTQSSPFDLNMSFACVYDGNDFAIHNFNSTALFNHNLGGIKNLGFINCNDYNIIVTEQSGGIIENCYSSFVRINNTLYNNPNIYEGRNFVVAETFGYTGLQDQIVMSSDSFASGAGTEADPYLIETPNQLASIGTLSNNQYVALANDILVNCSQNATKYRLNISGFSGYFDGRGYSIIGLINQPLVAALTGQITNVKLRGIRTTYNYTGLLANTIEQQGRVDNARVYGSIAGDQCGGIAGTNAGEISSSINYATVFGANSSGISGINNNLITKCVNKGKSYYGIAANGATGIINNCFDEGNTTNLHNSAGTINASAIKKLNAVHLWDNNNLIYNQPTLDIVTLREYENYDLNIWNYSVGQNNFPEIRISGKFYKQDIADSYFNKSLSFNRTYNPDVSNNIIEIEYQLVKNDNVREQITFVWHYNDNVIDVVENPLIRNAGIYKVYATYSGDYYVCGYTYEFTIKINKEQLPTPDFLGSAGIVGVHTPYIYNGEIYDVNKIKATNLESYGVSENDYSYVVSQEGQPIEDIIDAGNYNVNITINNVNYTTFNTQMVVTISKADLDIIMQDKTIDYLGASPEYTYILQAQTNEGADAAEIANAYQNAQTAIGEAQGVAICDYEFGDNIGEYNIDFDISLTNYNVLVTKAILTVNAIPLTDEDITFDDNTEIYSGYIIPLLAQIEDIDITVEYLNNENKDVGVYEVSAVFSKQNYIDLELSAFLTVQKAPLTIKAKDQEIAYGETPPTYLLDEIYFLGQDDISCISGTALFDCSYSQGDDIASYDIFVSGLTSNNYDITFEKGVLNVTKALMTDIFTYDDVEYVYDGQQKTHSIDLLEYQTNVTYNYYSDQVLLENPPIDVGVYEVTAYVYSINNNYQNTLFIASLTINKADLEVYFLTQYNLDYDGDFHNVDYEGTLPEGEVWTVYQTGIDGDSQTHSSFRDAGDYNITMTFTENSNYNNKTITTVLTIAPMLLEMNAFDTVYTTDSIIPEYQFNEEIIEGDTIDIFWKFSVYGYGYENAVLQVKNAGSYTCYPQSLNKNYSITNTPDFTIERRMVSFIPFYVEFYYGDYKDFIYNSRSYTSGRDYIIQRNYYIEATAQAVDVEYYYNGPNAGTYDVVGIKATSNYDFQIASGSQTDKVRVIRRELSYEWNAESFTQEYNGAIQMPFEITLGNIVSGDTVSATIISNGNNKDVGVYSITAELSDNNNYSLLTSPITLEITKAPLKIRANDKFVVKGTEYVIYTATVTGLKGGETLTSLGQNLIFDCAYTQTSPTGASLSITIQTFALDNYDITFSPGELSVTSNQYPQMSMSSKTFVYDGNTKAISLNQALPSGAIINYQNNFKKDVGVYNVTAKITFPNSTVQNLSATLTITKATPELIVEDVVLPYYLIAKLQKNDIIGVGKLNGIELPGEFSWVGSTDLKRHINEYQVLFTPNDTHNINTATAQINVEGKVVGEEALAFNKQNVIIIKNEIYISEQTVLTLSNEYDNLTLYHNGAVEESIILNNSGEYNIKIKYGDVTVFSKSYNVIRQSEDDEEEDLWPEGTEKFSITGGALKDDDNVGKITVDKDEIVIRINEEYAEDMELFLNGVKVPFIIFYGDEQQADIQVKYKGILIYSKTFQISVAPPEEENEPNEYNWQWLIILGSVLGGIAIIVLGIFAVKKLGIIGKKGYNPYETVERKRKKLKKKFK